MRFAASLLLLVLFASCHAGAPSFREPSPVPGVTPAGGGTLPAGNPPERATAPCRETARIRCASEYCGTVNTDYVTIACPDGRTSYRCVANTSCQKPATGG